MMSFLRKKTLRSILISSVFLFGILITPCYAVGGPVEIMGPAIIYQGDFPGIYLVTPGSSCWGSPCVVSFPEIFQGAGCAGSPINPSYLFMGPSPVTLSGRSQWDGPGPCTTRTFDVIPAEPPNVTLGLELPGVMWAGSGTVGLTPVLVLPLSPHESADIMEIYGSASCSGTVIGSSSYSFNTATPAGFYWFSARAHGTLSQAWGSCASKLIGIQTWPTIASFSAPASGATFFNAQSINFQVQTVLPPFEILNDVKIYSGTNCGYSDGGILATGASYSFTPTLPGTYSFSTKAQGYYHDILSGMVSPCSSITINVKSVGSCDLPWGQTLLTGTSATAYLYPTVISPAACTSETRTCTNGSLSGSYSNQNCEVLPSGSCELPWGGAILSGASATAYQSSTVVSPATCASESRTCTSGSLGGSYGNQSCVVTGTGSAAVGSCPVGQVFTAPASSLAPIVPENTTTISTPLVDTGANPAGIVVSPNGTSVYAVNQTSNTVSMYSRNISTGVLTALSPATIAAGSAPTAIAISPDGTSVYATNRDSANVSMYSRNTSTGVLTALSPAIIASGNGPRNIAVSPDSAFVYVSNMDSGTVSLYSRDIGTGILVPLATPTIAVAGPTGVDISPDGTSAYVANNTNTLSMFSRNISTGNLTPLATPTIAAGTFTWDVTVSPDGLFVYATNRDSANVSMYSRNTSTGALTALTTPTIAAGTGPFEIVISADRFSAYVANNGSNNVSMYSRNVSTGILTALSPATFAAGTGPRNLTITSDGTSVYVTNNTSNTIQMYTRSATVN